MRTNYCVTTGVLRLVIETGDTRDTRCVLLFKILANTQRFLKPENTWFTCWGWQYTVKSLPITSWTFTKEANIRIVWGSFWVCHLRTGFSYHSRFALCQIWAFYNVLWLFSASQSVLYPYSSSCVMTPFPPKTLKSMTIPQLLTYFNLTYVAHCLINCNVFSWQPGFS